MSNHTVTVDYRVHTAAFSQLCFKLPAVEGKSKLQRHHIETFESSAAAADCCMIDPTATHPAHTDWSHNKFLSCLPWDSFIYITYVCASLTTR